MVCQVLKLLLFMNECVNKQKIQSVPKTNWQERSRSPRDEANIADFWSSPKDLQSWQDEVTKHRINFQAQLVLPNGQRSPGDAPLAVAFYFSGLGHEARDILKMDWGSFASCPFILIVPQRPSGRWWFIDDDAAWGWVEGEFCQELVEAFAAWMNMMIDHPRVDKRRLGLFGFSAGAYAVLEMFASGLVPISRLAVGGLHGHGQPNVKHIPQKRSAGVVEKFEKFLQRVEGHAGAEHIEVVHGKTDKQCPWLDAKKIVDALTKKQLQLGCPKVKLRLLDAHEQDTFSKRNKTHHDYMKAAFMRKEFFKGFFADKVPHGEANMASPKRPLPSASMPSASTLEVAKFTVSTSMDGWEEQGFQIFRKSGFVIIEDVLDHVQCSEVLEDCRQMAKEIVAPQGAGNRGKGRYSFGVASSTGSILHREAIAKHLLNEGGRLLQPLLSQIFFDESDRLSSFSCYSGGGDFVLPGVEEYQHLHADMQVKKDLDKQMPPPFLAINFVVQDLTELNGPMRIVPGKRERDWRNQKKEPDRWRCSRLCPVPAGSALVRDVRILHGGTPNLSEETRFLPSVEYVSAWFRATHRPDMFPPRRCIPQDVFVTLHSDVQQICEELVAEPGDDTEDMSPDDDWHSKVWRGVTFWCT
ncbi:unnamed protein product [Durusdinium trenchii]|uniref:Feruloyl esterase n=1 Tax=Durusdinium trenchii TaxID=1381693 RepID=A0ABP0PIX2_9DINO